MKELIAKNPMNGLIINLRYDEETGTRFYKFAPQSISGIVKKQIKTQFASQGSQITESTSGWLKIERPTNPNDKMQEVGKKASKELKGDDTIEKEASMLKAAGFSVKIRDI